MTLATLTDVLQPALADGYAVAGLVVLGWEDARAFVSAAEAENAPVILQAGPSCRKHTPLPVLASMFRTLAKNSDVPVVAHLDHGMTFDECREAIDCGFTSVMYDGSRDGLAQNIDATAAIAEIAHNAGVSLEGEIGVVGYVDGEPSAATDPNDAAKFAAQSGADAMAISVGNVHLSQSKTAEINLDALKSIESVTDLPLVIHGGSGVSLEGRRKLATETKVCKLNIGTELRMAFGAALRSSVNRDSDRFDRIAILAETHEPVMSAARTVIRTLRASAQ